MAKIQGKSILVQVSARFELARVRVIVGRLYFREGLLSEGFLRLRFGGLIYGRFYYRKFTVYSLYGIFHSFALN